MGFNMAATFESGEEAVAKARTLKPDLVLMDIKLSGTIDGIEAAKKIKHELDIPVIFVTGSGDLRTRKRAAEIQPYEYLVKPVEMNVLQKVIEKSLTQVA